MFGLEKFDPRKAFGGGREYEVPPPRQGDTFNQPTDEDRERAWKELDQKRGGDTFDPTKH